MDSKIIDTFGTYFVFNAIPLLLRCTMQINIILLMFRQKLLQCSNTLELEKMAGGEPSVLNMHQNASSNPRESRR